jgi:diguanylate cyclase (GGDEF)-like protein
MLRWNICGKKPHVLASGWLFLFVDADRFKEYNDAYGHETGDGALQFIAHCLYNRVKSRRDIVARYGGEEFVVALSATTERQAIEIAEAIRTDVANPSSPGEHSRLPSLTVSIGLVVLWPGDGVPLTSAMSVADRALYESKK